MNKIISILPNSAQTSATYFALTRSKDSKKHPQLWDQLVKSNTVTFNVFWEDVDIIHELEQMAQQNPVCAHVFSDSTGYYTIYEEKCSEWSLTDSWDSPCMNEVSIDDWD